MGDVATDVFTIGGVSIKDQQFAIAYGDPSIDFSILGLSYASGENQVNNEGKPVSQGDISCPGMKHIVPNYLFVRNDHLEHTPSSSCSDILLRRTTDAEAL